MAKKKPCNNPPRAILAMPTTGLVGVPVTITVTGADADGSIVSGQIWFGDGTTQTFSGPSLTTTHVYSVPGTYTVQAVVQDNAKASVGASTTIVISTTTPPIPGPTILCPASITRQAPTTDPTTVTFPPALVTGGIAPIVVVATPASGTLFPIGASTVTVVATDALGRTATCYFGVIITPPDPVDPPDPPDPPSAPANLDATALSATSVQLDWDDTSSTETAFRIERCTGTGCSGFIQIALAAASAITATDLTVAPNTTYRYRVLAINEGGASAASNVVEVTTPMTPPTPDTIPPTVPTGLAAGVPTQTSVGLTWTPSTDAVGVTGYGVYVGTAKIQDVLTPSTLITNLVCGTTYSLSVDAVDAAGNRSARTATVAITTVACVTPPVPVLTSVSVSPASVGAGSPALLTVTLTAAAPAGGLVVTLSSSRPEVTVVPTLTVSAGNLTASTLVQTASSAPTLTATLTAVLAAVTKTTALTVTMIPPVPDTTPPTTPGTPVVSNVTQTGLTLTWVAATDANGIAGYGIYQGPSRILNVGGATLSTPITGLLCGTAYTYSVDAVDPAGNRSPQSASRVTATAPCAPSPTLASASVAPSSVVAGSPATLTLTLNLPATAGGLTVLLSSSAPSVAQVGATVTIPAGQLSTTTPITTTPTAPSTVVTLTGTLSGVSRQTALTVTAQPPPPTAPSAPTNLTAIPTTSPSVQLAWTDTAQNESGFTIERCEGVGCSGFVQIAAVAANTVTFVDSTVCFETVYRYQVRAWNSVGASAYSNLATTTTPDLIPDPFTFLDQTGVATSTLIIGAAVTLTGFTFPTTFTALGGTLSVNGGAFAASGTVTPGASIRPRVLSSASPGTATSVLVTIEDVSDTFTVTTTSGGQSLLTSSDLTLLGILRFPTVGVWDLRFAYLSPALRILPNGDRHFYATGPATVSPPNSLLEFDLTGLTPAMTIAAAPQCPLVLDHGGGMDPLVLHGAAGYYVGGGVWEEARQVLWVTVGDLYVPNVDWPTLLAWKASTNTWYGPWTFDVGTQRGRGHLGELPSWFTSAYLTTETLFVSAGQSSGAAGSPFGVNGHAWTSFDPVSKPPSTLLTPSIVTTRTFIFHDLTHPQARDTRYKQCGWSVPYSCAKGPATLQPGIPFWGGADQGAATTDTYYSAGFINTPGRKGYLALAQLAGTRVGSTATYDPDGLHHRGYGAYRADDDPTRPDSTCCHGGVDPSWRTTGPFAMGKVFRGLIYNPAQFGEVLAGSRLPYACTPADDLEMATLAGGSLLDFDNFPQGGFAGMMIDQANRLLYCMGPGQIFDQFFTYPAGHWPILLVFRIAA